MTESTVDAEPRAAAKPGLALLVDVALVPGLAAALWLAVVAGWTLGSLVGALVIGLVIFVGRGPYSPARTGLVITASALYLAFFGFWTLVYIALSCPKPTHPSIALAAAGAVLVGIALLSLWKRIYWGIPAGILIAFVVLWTVYTKLPALPMDCSD
jgi:hypothetical protein